MAADLTDLRRKIEEHAVALCETALLGVFAELDFNVPDSDKNPVPRTSPRVGPKLRDTRFVIGPVARGREVITVVGYTAPQAVYTNEGTDAHPIPVGGSSEQMAKGYPLHFYWQKAGGFVYRWSVNWKPGPGVAANIGWFNRSLVGWSDFLADATNRVTS